MSVHARVLRAALAIGLVAPMLTGCFEEPSPHEAVRGFLVGWQTGDYVDAAKRVDGDPATVRSALQNFEVQLDAASIRFSLTGIQRTGDDAKAEFRAQVDLGENNPLWEYDGALPMHLVGGEWKVRWSPSIIHPDLHAGQRLAVATVPEGRKPVLDNQGNPLQEETKLYVAGVYPAKVKDPGRLCDQLSKVTGFAQDRLLSRILSSPPQEFVPLATFGGTKYASIQAKLAAIKDLDMQVDHPPVAPKSPVQIVGRVAAITPEAEQQLGGPQRAGDTVGRDGLQKAYQDQLTGSTETRVVILDSATSKQVKELKAWPGRKNDSVRTTIDSRVQHAGDGAVAGSRPAALVAVNATTGEVLAVSTNQLNQEKDALAGKYPPGTAFSIVASDALLKGGLKPSQRLPCSADRTVGGARFTQPGLLGAETPTFSGDFAQGCVTALASLARRVDGAAIAESASKFGIGGDWGLPLKTFTGSIPEAATDAAVAKMIAGQSVRVSPLSMALVAAAVDSGTWRPPVLVTSPSTPDASAEAPPTVPPAPQVLDPARVATLRALMRVGVTRGTARGAAARGEAVHGVASEVTQVVKKKRTNLSWFVGWQGDVAVAVLSHSADATTSAGIAGDFFRYLQMQSNAQINSQT
ncbi:penicillin-binding protein [Planotetraspora mira]|uniref:Penicillin-binding protein n=1 Tax=Planotetraspora mira TaxID=58121 RepID=A0A8J3TW22_9ACTN|nr:penicillin-binding protein [Planotetraspora mira]